MKNNVRRETLFSKVYMHSAFGVDCNSLQTSPRSWSLNQYLHLNLLPQIDFNDRNEKVTNFFGKEN